MRAVILGLSVALTGCAAATSTMLSPADASTSLIAGGAVNMSRSVTSTGSDDPLVFVTLAHADGRRMLFEEANHTPNDLRVQSVGGPLAQVMGLFGDERPTLLLAREHQGAPFICGVEGPVAIGLYEDSASQTVRIVGLRQNFQFEDRPDGTTEALPYSPDQVCARLTFRRS